MLFQKTINVRFSNFYSFFIVLVFFILFVKPIKAEEIAQFQYKKHIENLNDTVLKVNEDFAALTEYMYVDSLCDTSVGSGASSVIFLIDQSTSMFLGFNAIDSAGARFSVSSALIDTIYRRNPKTAVGLIFFHGGLYLTPSDDQILEQCPQDPAGGYFPLLQLDTDYNGRTGYEILQYWLETELDSLGTFLKYVDLKHKKNQDVTTLGGTNITLGFDAAKHGMASSKHPKDKRYIIYFSDGDATVPSDNPAKMFEFIEGKDVPTTFTVYFTDADTTLDNLKKMTENIKNNGYSASNPLSNLWSSTTDKDSLMNLLMKNVIEKIILKNQISTPISFSVNTINPTGPWDKQGFPFQDKFGLEIFQTLFNCGLTAQIITDSITNAGDTITDTLIKDSEIKFTVDIEPGAPDLSPDDFAVAYWERSIGMYNQGTVITAVNESMDELELRFKEEKIDILYGYSNVDLEVKTAIGTIPDKELFSLNKVSDYFSFTFKTAPNTAASPGDGTLQLQDNDEITVIFRNEKLPRDTLIIQIPFTYNTIILKNVSYFDNNAEGYIDSIYVEASAGGLTNVQVTEIVDKALKLPSFRGFIVNSAGVTPGGFFLKVTEDRGHNPVTYVTNEDIVEVTSVILNAGGLVQAATIKIIDRVAPIIHWEARSALLADYQVSGKTDTLTVKFSEPVQNISSDEPFYFLDVGSNSNYTVTLRAAGMPAPDKMAFEVVSVSGTMEDGDSLWIHETDRVCDTIDNYQNNPQNIKRRLYIDKMSGSVAFDCGYYFDNTGDGFVDSIFLKSTTDIEGGYTEAMVDEIVQKALTLPAFRNLTVNNSGLTTGGFFLSVTESSTNPTTYVTVDDKLVTTQVTLANGGQVPAKTVPVYDKVAPLIHWEARSALAIVHQDESVTDTLLITFSEPVKKVTATVPFRFLSIQNATPYTATLTALGQPSPDKLVFAVSSISSIAGIDKMCDGDSVWIYEGDRVGDECKDESGNTVTNYQNNVKNTKRRLYVEQRLLPFSLIPVAVSPLDIKNIEKSDQYVIPDKYITIFENQGILNDLNLGKNSDGKYVGMIINIVPDKLENVFEGFKLKGTITILDPVGNKIIEKNKMGWDDEKKRLIFAWNLKNSNGRKVGTSMYLCLFEIEETTEGVENTGLKKTKKILVGTK